MKMFIQLVAGDKIRPKMTIIDGKIRNWKYAKECSSVGGGMMPHASLTIVEVSNQFNDKWLKAEIDGSHGSSHLKITPEEFAMNFYCT